MSILKKIIITITIATILFTSVGNAYAAPKLALNPANHTNPGAIKGYNEAKGMIDIALRTKREVNRNNLGSRVFWSGYRKNWGDTGSLRREVNSANSYKPSLFVAMHSDGVPKSRGIFVLYKNTKGKNAGKIIGKHIAKKMGLKFEGVSHRPELIVLKKSKAPAILIEYLSHANLKDNRKLNDPKYRQELAKATAEGYMKYWKLPAKKKVAAKKKSVKKKITKKVDNFKIVKPAYASEDKNTRLNGEVGQDEIAIKKEQKESKVQDSVKSEDSKNVSDDTQNTENIVEQARQNDIVGLVAKGSIELGASYLKISFGVRL